MITSVRCDINYAVNQGVFQAQDQLRFTVKPAVDRVIGEVSYLVDGQISGPVRAAIDDAASMLQP